MRIWCVNSNLCPTWIVLFRVMAWNCGIAGISWLFFFATYLLMCFLIIYIIHVPLTFDKWMPLGPKNCIHLSRIPTVIVKSTLFLLYWDQNKSFIWWGYSFTKIHKRDIQIENRCAYHWSMKLYHTQWISSTHVLQLKAGREELTG